MNERIYKNENPRKFSAAERQSMRKRFSFGNFTNNNTTPQNSEPVFHSSEYRTRSPENLKSRNFVNEKGEMKALVKGGMRDSEPKICQDRADSFYLDFGNTIGKLMFVCDGHGPDGEKIAKFLSDNIVKDFFLMLQRPKTKMIKMSEALKEFVIELDQKVENHFKSDERITYYSGSTLTLVFLCEDRGYCAWVGDSKAIIVNDSGRELTYKNLTRNHNPYNPEEYKRITDAGGLICSAKYDDETTSGPLRIWFPPENQNNPGKLTGPGLNITRSIGDRFARKIGFTQVPSVVRFDLDEDSSFVVLGSDGLWDFLRKSEVVNIVDRFSRSNDAESATKALYERAEHMWRVNSRRHRDDISIVVAYI